jgi:hypothetical protein
MAIMTSADLVDFIGSGRRGPDREEYRHGKCVGSVLHGLDISKTELAKAKEIFNEEAVLALEGYCKGELEDRTITPDFVSTKRRDFSRKVYLAAAESLVRDRNEFIEVSRYNLENPTQTEYAFEEPW